MKLVAKEILFGLTFYSLADRPFVTCSGRVTGSRSIRFREWQIVGAGQNGRRPGVSRQIVLAEELAVAVSTLRWRVVERAGRGVDRLAAGGDSVERVLAVRVS